VLRVELVGELVGKLKKRDKRGAAEGAGLGVPVDKGIQALRQAHCWSTSFFVYMTLKIVAPSGSFVMASLRLSKVQVSYPPTDLFQAGRGRNVEALRDLVQLAVGYHARSSRSD
jgi:hypothetical protein